ncbi:MAG TPA: signal peptidase I [Candidatus Avimonas sp.]|nr:signal peptidase I [Candidatus Avimonas sp.]
MSSQKFNVLPSNINSLNSFRKKLHQSKVVWRIISGLYEWVGAALYSLVCVVLAFIFVFRIVGVEGDSMNPTLHDGERLILLTFMYRPQRGDIVVIDRYTQEPLVKRVIAVGGDEIAILPDTGEVVLNGVVQEEEYTKGKTLAHDFGTSTKKVPKGYLVVMGDNRENSKDSRSAEVGFVNEKDIVGKAIFRFYPLNKMKWLNLSERHDKVE